MKRRPWHSSQEEIDARRAAVDAPSAPRPRAVAQPIAVRDPRVDPRPGDSVFATGRTQDRVTEVGTDFVRYVQSNERGFYAARRVSLAYWRETRAAARAVSVDGLMFGRAGQPRQISPAVAAFVGPVFSGGRVKRGSAPSRSSAAGRSPMRAGGF